MRYQIRWHTLGGEAHVRGRALSILTHYLATISLLKTSYTNARLKPDPESQESILTMLLDSNTNTVYPWF